MHPETPTGWMNLPLGLHIRVTRDELEVTRTLDGTVGFVSLEGRARQVRDSLDNGRLPDWVRERIIGLVADWPNPAA